MQALSDESIQGFDLALFSAGSGASEEWAPRFADAGAVVVDNSSQWRMHEDVPLVVSEVNPEALDCHNGIVANPNCTTMQMVVALKPILDAVGIERIVMSSYQSVSGTGSEAVEELHDQTKARSPPRRSRRRPCTRTRSPSTCCRRSRSSRTATTTRPRSASDGRDAQDPRPRRHRRLRHLRARAGVHRPLGVGQRPDARAALARGVPRAARLGARAWSWSTTPRTASTRSRSTPPAATRCSWAASAATPRTSAASTSGSWATTCARARPPTRSSWPSCSTCAACCAFRRGLTLARTGPARSSRGGARHPRPPARWRASRASSRRDAIPSLR